MHLSPTSKLGYLSFKSYFIHSVIFKPYLGAWIHSISPFAHTDLSRITTERWELPALFTGGWRGNFTYD